MNTKWNRVLRAAPMGAALAGVLTAGASAQVAPAPIDDADRVVVPRSVHRLARPEFDRGRTDPGLPMERMILSLALRRGAARPLERLLANQQNPASPDYHRWLTPEQFGERFGRSAEDVQAAATWLRDHGFTVDEIAAGRGWIDFSGTAAQVEAAFGTEIHDYEVGGRLHHANATDPSLPRGLAAIANGIVSLNSFPRQPHHRNRHPVSPEELTPEYTSSTGNHYVAPADFATIYNLNSLYSAGTDGTGRTIAIVGRTDISLGDVQFFRSFFGLPANDPVFVHNGADPGNLGDGEEGEADLDVQWSGAVAPRATIKFVISKSTATTDGVDLSAQYIVNNNVGDAMSTSFGQCESSMGATEVTFYGNLWAQAAAQGITSFVSSGDSGAAGCNAGSDTTGSGQAVSGLCTSPNNVCVGGSQFADTSNPSAYWSSTNNSTTQASALSYIPEVAWNESGSVSGGSGLWATGGGASNSFAKPTWQSAPGVPSDGKRDVPDVSLTAAGHDGYLVFQGHTTGTTGLGAVGGTSASSPSFAGLMALVVQKTGARQGNANTVFYQMATAQYGGAGPAVFHDVTSGSNSVPGVTGFACGTGYDRATGLGSVDGAALVNNWGGSTTPDFSVSASPASVGLVQGGSGTSTITVGSTNSFASAVSLSATGLPSGVTASFAPSSVTPPANGTAASTLTLTASAAAATGTFNVTVTGTSGATTHNTAVSLSVTAAGAFSAVFDATLKAPKCASAGISCDSGPSLLLGRAALGPEPNQPNTIAGSCADGTSGTFHSDESNDRIKVSTTDGSTLAPGKTVRIDATVWAWTTPSSDHLDLFYAADAASPVWNLITTLTPTAAGANTLSATYTLPSGGSLQAVRANFRYQSSAGACVAAAYTDHDDLVFAVGAGPPDTTPPTTSITAPASGATVSGTVNVTASASDNVGVTRVEFYVDGALASTDTTSPYSFSWATSGYANGSSHGLSSNAYDAAGNVGTSATVTVTVNNSAVAQTAAFDATLRAPKCAVVGISCDSGPSLLLGRATLGPEPNQPNTIAGSCADGTSGTFHSDESSDRIKVSTTDGSGLAAGKTVRVDATVWAWTTPSADHLDLYYAANANSPTWTFIGTITPTAAGAQTLSATYTLPAGSLQAVRANFRYQSSAGSCVAGAYTDHDDLVFAVQ